MLVQWSVPEKEFCLYSQYVNPEISDPELLAPEREVKKTLNHLPLERERFALRFCDTS